MNFPINNEIVVNAMENLKNDPDFLLDWDSKTIKHGFFHASNDSKNAHSHLCREISKNISGYFIYTCINKNKREVKNIESLNRLTFQLNNSRFFSDYYELIVVVEERNEFKKDQIEPFIKKFYRDIEKVAYLHPTIINIFPKLSLNVMSKNNSGLQVTDFVLWAVDRSFSLKDDTWVKRIGLVMSEKYNYKDNSEFGGCYEIGGIHSYSEQDLSLNYQFNAPNQIPKKHLSNYDYFIFIENILLATVKFQIPQYSIHLKDKLLNTIRLIETKTYNSDSIDFICSTFIQFFDTFPIYRRVSNHFKEFWLDILYAKRLSGAILRNGSTQLSGNISDFIINNKRINNEDKKAIKINCKYLYSLEETFNYLSGNLPDNFIIDKINDL